MQEDDINLDEIFSSENLKPITKGLGFHHSIKEKRKVETSLKSKQVSLERDLYLKSKKAKASQNTETFSKIKVGPSTSEREMGDLSPFYRDTSQEAPSIETELEAINTETNNKKVEVNHASLPFRLIAYATDLFIVGLINLIVFGSILFFEEIPLSFIKNFASNSLNVLLLFLYSISTYLFYFSFMDTTRFSTLGKRMMNLKVVNLTEDQPSVLQSISRSLICLTGLFTLGLTTILDFQSKFTNTSVINND